MRILIAILLSLIAVLAWTFKAAPARETFAGSVVKVTQPGGHGSGVHIGDGYVLTAAHVLSPFVPPKVIDDGGAVHAVEWFWTAKDYDFALMKMQDAGHGIAVSDLSCAAPEVGSAVRGAGYAMDIGLVEVWGKVASKAREIGNWKRASSSDMSVLQGQSGGPVFNTKEQVTGLMVGYRSGIQGEWTGFSMFVPGDVVCTLLGRQ
jgi:S1-C subfamily serine protease